MNRVACLDGLRGLAALWVLVGHTMLLTGFLVPIVSKPDLGVDLFILLSGFLMVYQYQLRSEREDWSRAGTWLAFWTRRFFRIAPLYYVLLIAALVLGAALYDARLSIDLALGRHPQAPARYLDHSLTNIVLHGSFLYGLLPSFAYRTPLPDWSLALEMQFYAVFPLVVVAAKRFGWLPVSALGVLLALAVVTAMNHAGVHFPMPAFLPLKAHLFFAGMLVAVARTSTRPAAIYLLAVLALAAIPVGGDQDRLHFVVRELVALTFFSLVRWSSSPVGQWTDRLLGSPIFHWLGELSYGVYLIHLLILQPAAAYLLKGEVAGLTAMARFDRVLPVVLLASYGLAWLGYRFVEQPGQVLGRQVIALYARRRSLAASTSAEQIGAP